MAAAYRVNFENRGVGLHPAGDAPNPPPDRNQYNPIPDDAPPNFNMEEEEEEDPVRAAQDERALQQQINQYAERRGPELDPDNPRGIW